MLNGKTHYFDWAIFHRYLHYQMVNRMNPLKTSQKFSPVRALTRWTVRPRSPSGAARILSRTLSRTLVRPLMSCWDGVNLPVKTLSSWDFLPQLRLHK